MTQGILHEAPKGGQSPQRIVRGPQRIWLLIVLPPSAFPIRREQVQAALPRDAPACHLGLGAGAKSSLSGLALECVQVSARCAHQSSSQTLSRSGCKMESESWSETDSQSGSKKGSKCRSKTKCRSGSERGPQNSSETSSLNGSNTESQSGCKRGPRHGSKAGSRNGSKKECESGSPNGVRKCARRWTSNSVRRLFAT